jgi:tetratricopeptide (TPR) repeat protein
MFRHILHVMMIIAMVFLFQTGPAEAARVMVDVGSLSMTLYSSDAKLITHAGLLADLRPTQVSWPVQEVSPTIYHIQVPGMGERFLRLDLEAHKVYEVSGGTFGKAGGAEQLLKDAHLESPFRDPMGNTFRFSVGLAPGTLIYDTETKGVTMQFAGYAVMGPREIEVIEPESGIYHIRVRGAQDPRKKEDRFWRVDARLKTLKSVIGTYGERGGKEITFDHQVTVEDPRAASAPVVHEDLGMAGVGKESLYEASWTGAERELFQEIFLSKKFDVLVVPVQVQENAFDHSERALMTYILARRIAAATGLKVADSDQVERVLGRWYRTFPEQRIYKLANALGVRTLIRMYAGHGRDMKMRLTLSVQDRQADDSFDTATKQQLTTFTDIPFTDEQLPAEAFAGLLDKIVAATGLKEKRAAAPAPGRGKQHIAVPDTLLDLVKSKGRPSVTSAAHLAFLGAMSPSYTPTSELFFLRALAILRDVMNGPGVPFLKAYALTGLTRRPAALDVLRNPAVPEERALRAYLDGDLAVFQEQLTKVQEPLPRALMQVLLMDMLWDYDPGTARSRSKMAAPDVPKAWKPFAVRRVARADPWEVPDALELKKLLDDLYPVPGFSLTDVGRSMLVRGELAGGDLVQLDASFPEHRRRLLKEQPGLVDSDSPADIVPLDLLDLVEAWAEDTVIKRIGLPVNVQALYEEGAAMVDRYEPYFRGHPELTVLKSRALYSLSRQKGGEEGKNLSTTAGNLSHNACVQFQGQQYSANYACWYRMFYENDFPRRPFWRRHNDSGMYGDRADYVPRETVITGYVPRVTVITGPVPTIPLFLRGFNAEVRDRDLALRYTTTYFGNLKAYHDFLVSRGSSTSAETLLERNKHRFNGSPGKTTFAAWQLEKKGDEPGIVKLYEETIALVPGVWSPYYGLGYQYLKRGQVPRAVETFQRFPLFREDATRRGDDHVDTVALSNNAYRAGAELHWAGAGEEARPFFERSAGYQTGSGSGMHSEYLLALVRQDYQQAAHAALTLGRRYTDYDAYSDYLRLLHVTGHAQDAEPLFTSLGLMERGTVDWSPVLTGLRMAGTSDAEIRSWLAEKGKGKIGRTSAQYYYIAAFLCDRPPDDRLASMIENIDQQVTLSPQDKPTKVMDAQRRVVPPYTVLIASSRQAIAKKEYGKAFDMLEQWFTYPRTIEDGKGSLLLAPYAWAGAKTGKAELIERTLNEYRAKHGRSFDYWLALATMQAAGGSHDAALLSLDRARYNINSNVGSMRTPSPWYQLVDLCEVLFESTGNAAYRDRALALARLHQKVNPLEAWAYAVEARYAATADERLRPLAITIYLDRRSYHIYGIAEQEKEKAQKWLETNNPFLQTKPRTMQEVLHLPAGETVYRVLAMTAVQ